MMHCFFGKGEQCNYIHCNSVGGEGCISHKGWQNKREREKKKTFSIKAAEIPMACALHSESPSYNIHCEQQATFIHYTHTHKKSLVKYLFPTRHSHCFLQIPDSSQYFSLRHACMPVHTRMHTHSHMHAHKQTCIHTHTRTHAHTHTFCTVYPVTMLKHPHLPHPQSPPHPHLPPANKTMTML